MELIQPIRMLGPCECRCGRTVVLKEIDYIFTLLGQDGSPLEYQNITKMVGVCPSCHQQYKMEKDGLLFRIKGRAPGRFEGREGKQDYFDLNDKTDRSNPFRGGNEL